MLIQLAADGSLVDLPSHNKDLVAAEVDLREIGVERKRTAACRQQAGLGRGARRGAAELVELRVEHEDVVLCNQPRSPRSENARLASSCMLLCDARYLWSSDDSTCESETGQLLLPFLS